jgi:hypothetical protein
VTVRATLTGNNGEATSFVGDFSAELQDIHVGSEVDVTVTPAPAPQEEAPAPAEAQ